MVACLPNGRMNLFQLKTRKEQMTQEMYILHAWETQAFDTITLQKVMAV